MITTRAPDGANKKILVNSIKVETAFGAPLTEFWICRGDNLERGTFTASFQLHSASGFWQQREKEPPQLHLMPTKQLLTNSTFSANPTLMWTYRKKVHLIYIELLKNRSGCQKTFFWIYFQTLAQQKDNHLKFTWWRTHENARYGSWKQVRVLTLKNMNVQHQRTIKFWRKNGNVVI